MTPLREGGQLVDEDAFAALLDFYCHSSLDGLLVLGTTGEGILLSREERSRVAELAVAGAAALRVIVHCGAQTTAETCALAADAAEVGAAAVAVIGPPYFPLAAEELLAHFAAAAAACEPLPFYLYENADRIGYQIPLDVIEQLRDRVSNLAGIKVSDAPFDQARPYLTTGLDVFIGPEGVILEGLEHGAVGAVSGVAAVFPEAVSELVRDPTPERSALAKALRTELSVNPFQASVKVALAFRGIPIRPDVRAPLRPISPPAAERLRASLDRLAPLATATR